MKRACPRLVVAALRGGCGKTTLSLALISAWREQGRRIIPFKKGPDYIDAGWLAQAAGSQCYNLDPYLMNPEQLLGSFIFRIPGADGAVIEGNRGLYDGTDRAGTYSTAQLAKLLDAPTILVLDCTKVTRTLAAVVLGCRQFDPEVRLAGVILNQVGTSRQEALIRSTIEESTGMPVLGAVPRVRGQDLPERHLGLIPHQEHPQAQKVLKLLAEMAFKYIDLDRLWQTALSAPDLREGPSSLWPTLSSSPRPPVRIGVIRDSVFQFYYPENLEALERLGTKLVVFSSLARPDLPEVDALYLGGGFPETQAEVLAGNEGLCLSIRRAAESGLPIYAECGGLMYLGRTLLVQDKAYPMAGVFPVTFGLEERPQGHGYSIVRADRPNPFYPIGQELIGHEFHYSRPVEYEAEKVNLVFAVKRGSGFDRGRDGLAVNNVLGTYTHLHALTSHLWAEALVDQAVKFSRSRTRPEQPEVKP